MKRREIPIIPHLMVLFQVLSNGMIGLLFIRSFDDVSTLNQLSY
ncbi:hypothetical protein ACM26V_07575 [Salipaludibacillus sp. HK11]